MMPKGESRWGISVIACVLLGCSSPREHLYSLGLQSLQRPVFNRDARTILVGPVSIPELVDRPQIVLSKNEVEVVINEQQRWASPLKESLPRVLATNLEQRLLGTRFVALSGANAAEVDGRLTLDVRLLLLDADQGADISASWTYRDSNPAGPALEGDAHAHADLREPGYPGVVDALNRATFALAGDIANVVGTSRP